MPTYGTDWVPRDCGRCCRGNIDALGGESDDKWECDACGAIFDTLEDGIAGEVSLDYSTTTVER